MLPSQYAPHLHEVGDPILRRVKNIQTLQQRRLDMLDEAARMLVVISEAEDALGKRINELWEPALVQAAVRAVR